MEFELTPELIDQIIFGMENQDFTYYVDAAEEVVVSTENQDLDFDNEERFYDVPDWISVNGFQLMEKFVASLRNPLAREALRQSLAGGRGVFRNFKNSLHQHPDVEKLWFTFKDREMRRYVVDWYNDLSDVWGITKIALHEEETEELILSDFIISQSEPSDDAAMLEYEQASYSEIFAGFPDSWIEDQYACDKARYAKGNRIVLCAKTPAGELAGFLQAYEREFEDEGASIVFSIVTHIYVILEYRGLGVSKILITDYCGGAYERGVARISIQCPAAAMGYGERLEREGFFEVSRTYELDVDHWKRENSGG